MLSWVCGKLVVFFGVMLEVVWLEGCMLLIYIEVFGEGDDIVVFYGYLDK